MVLSGLDGQTFDFDGDLTAEESHPYAFSAASTFSNTVPVTATDRAGNITPTLAAIFNDNVAPTVVLTVPTSAALDFSVAWAATDAASGVRAFNLGYGPSASGPWTAWLTDTTDLSAAFLGLPDESYYFRVQALDNVGNVSDWWVEGPVTINTITKYYYHGGQRVAMRQGDGVYYLSGDHLGSTSLTTDSVGEVVHEARYLPYGQERWSSGTGVTDYAFTGQRVEAGFGLYDYNARFYSARVGRFVSADTVVPEPKNPQSLNRYSYTYNNPLNFIDPLGHFTEEDIPLLCSSCETWDDVEKYFGPEAYNLLKAGEVSFGSIIFAGADSGLQGKYTFTLVGHYDGHQDVFRMAVWDMENNKEVGLTDILAHEKVTVWSTNTEVPNGGYFYTNWDKGFIDEGEAEAWAKPWETGFADLKLDPHGAFTRYRVYTAWDFWFLVTMAGTALGGKPDTPAAFASLAIDVTDKSISMKNQAHISRVYPLVYKGNEWVGEGAPIYFSFYTP